MTIVCKNCGEEIVNPDEYEEHFETCNDTVACYERAKNKVNLY